jgi:hypothetical protein
MVSYGLVYHMSSFKLFTNPRCEELTIVEQKGLEPSSFTLQR